MLREYPNNLTTLARRLKPLISQMLNESGNIVGTSWALIVVIESNSTAIATFPNTTAGLTDALADAATKSGGLIWIGPGIYGDNSSTWTIPTGWGVSSFGNIVNILGTTTINGSSWIKGITFKRTISDAGACHAIEKASGSSIINDCTVIATNNGTGDAVAVYVSGGTLEIWQGQINAQATGGGDGYGIHNNGGTVSVTDDGRIQGSTAPTLGTVGRFSFDTEIKLLDGGGAISQVYPASDAGLTAALAAAGSGDSISLPALTISGGPWTVPAGVEAFGASWNTILDGNLTVQGAIRTLKITGNLTVSGGRAQIVNAIGNHTISNNGRVQHSIFEGSSGTILSITAGNFRNGGVAIEAGASLGVTVSSTTDNVTLSHVNITKSGVGSTGDGLYVDSTVAYISHVHVDVVGLAGDLRETLVVSHCTFHSSGDNGVEHSAGTTSIRNCRFETEDDVTYKALVLTAGAFRTTDCSWSSISGESNLVFGTGDRGAYKSTDYHADDIEDATWTHHWPKSNLTATAAPTADDDENDGYDEGSVWVDVTNDEAYICIDASAAAAVGTNLGGGASTFLLLTDVTEVSYSGAGGDVVAVNGAETGLEFVIPVDISDDGANISGVNFLEQSSDPSTPTTDHWVIYAKSDGLYVIDDAGNVVGPIGEVSPTGPHWEPATIATNPTNPEIVFFVNGDVAMLWIV